MVDPRFPRARDGQAEEDIVAAAFASYRARAVEEFGGPPPAAIMARAARSPRRRALTVSVAALACTGLMAAGVAVAQTVASGPDDDGVAADATSTASSDGGDAGGNPPTDGAPSSTSDPDVEAELRTLTISLPDWPGRLSELCPEGDYRFTAEDDADVPSGEPSESGSAGEDTPLGDWELLPKGTRAVQGDIAVTKPKEDKPPETLQTVVVPVSCGEVPGVVALTQGSDAFSSLGFVHAGRKAGVFVNIDSVRDGNILLAFKDSAEAEAVELREFSFDGEEFTEVTDPDDPTQDPDDPTQDPDDPTPSDDESSPDPGESSTEKPGETTSADDTHSDAQTSVS
ncbi:MAG: hypothetical protein ACRDXX_14590 [Stackebrandtia sp.]